MDNTLGLIGIARKAGLLSVGLGDCESDAKRKCAVLILIAQDAGENAKSRAEKCARLYNIEFYEIPYTRQELGNITGRGWPGVITLRDRGLADKILTGIVPHDDKSKAELWRDAADNNRTGKRRTVI